MITQSLKRIIKPNRCPLCGELQDGIIHGHTPSDKPNQVLLHREDGYSFCNCRNIWFTSWSNIKQAVYDPTYFDKYQGENVCNVMRKYTAYIPILSEHKPSGSVLDIGCINMTMMKEFKKRGYRSVALDIFPHPFDGADDLLVGSFEDLQIDEKFAIIWASHVFEHFKDPIAMVKKCHDILEDGGMAFISMPDPYFLDVRYPEKWGHWHLEEHHIMWDMESFCDVLCEQGFEIIMARHNADAGFICVGDFHVIARKK